MSTEGKHIDEATHEVCSVPNSLEYPIKPRSKLFHYARSFRLTRQLRLAWTSAVLTTIFLIMTAVYASQATIAARMRLLYTSSSNTIFVLSALSGLTSVFLASTIAAAFERLQWLLVSRKDGLEFTKFLGLQSGTGVAGLIALTVGSGHPLMTSTRLWSAGRLLTIVLVPALGVLIMSECILLLSHSTACCVTDMILMTLLVFVRLLDAASQCSFMYLVNPTSYRSCRQ